MSWLSEFEWMIRGMPFAVHATVVSVVLFAIAVGIKIGNLLIGAPRGWGSVLYNLAIRIGMVLFALWIGIETLSWAILAILSGLVAIILVGIFFVGLLLCCSQLARLKRRTDST